MTQEIIVYRNPFEQAMWNALMNGPVLFYVIVFLVVFFIVFSISNKLFHKAACKVVGWENEGYVHLAIGTIAATLSVWVLYV